MIKNNFINAYKSSEFIDIINGSAGQEAISPVIRNLRKRLGFIKEEDVIAHTDLNISTSMTPVNTTRPVNHTVQIDKEVINDMEKKGENRAASKVETSNSQKFKSKIVTEKQVDVKLNKKNEKKSIQAFENNAACVEKILKKPRKSQEIKDKNYKKFSEKLAIKNEHLSFKLNSMESKIFFRILEKISSKKDRIDSLEVVSKAKNAIEKYKTHKILHK